MRRTRLRRFSAVVAAEYRPAGWCRKAAAAADRDACVEGVCPVHTVLGEHEQADPP